jgi:hypothetical protein
VQFFGAFFGQIWIVRAKRHLKSLRTRNRFGVSINFLLIPPHLLCAALRCRGDSVGRLGLHGHVNHLANSVLFCHSWFAVNLALCTVVLGLSARGASSAPLARAVGAELSTIYRHSTAHPHTQRSVVPLTVTGTPPHSEVLPPRLTSVSASSWSRRRHSPAARLSRRKLFTFSRNYTDKFHGSGGGG